MNQFTMVVPTYWVRPESSAQTEPQSDTEIVFDHPTPLNTDGTLPRLLDSLDVLDQTPDLIVIIPVHNRREIAVEVEAKVNQLVTPYRSRRSIQLFGHAALSKVKQNLRSAGVSARSLEILNLHNYAGVRNICALAGILNSAQFTTFIDDDELFIDPAFFNKLSNTIGTCQASDSSSGVGGHKRTALAGYYLQPDTYRLDESNVPAWRAEHWNTAAAMNRAFDLTIARDPLIKPTPFVFGGNMTLARDVLIRTPFDPRITRGEDIDFLLNLRIHGTVFYLHRDLPIKHLPPSSPQQEWKKFREDALRFLYERKKISDHNLPLHELQPYPGTFLGPDLDRRIIRTAETLKRHYQDMYDRDGIARCDEIISLAERNPFAAFNTRTWLIDLSARWREITSAALGLRIPL